MAKKEAPAGTTRVDAAPHVPRNTMPTMPRNLEAQAQDAIHRIRTAAGWTTNLAIMEISNVRTMNLHPAVASYKTEVLEYLKQLPGA